MFNPSGAESKINMKLGQLRKPLHGQFVKETAGAIDVSQQWKWLLGSNLIKECEVPIMAA